MINYPTSADSDEKRLAYVHAAMAKARDLYNLFGDWVRDGIDQARWELLPPELQAQWPYQAQITQEQFNAFLDNLYSPLEADLVDEQLRLRAAVESSAQFDPQLSDWSPSHGA